MIFTITFAALFAAHQFGDHWPQRHADALGKGAPDRQGRSHCLNHVLHLTAVKVAAVVLAFWATGVWPPVWAGVLVLALDAASHYWADRGAFHSSKDETRPIGLERLARAVGKGPFWVLGRGTVGADGSPVPTIGTGAYALDQSFHVAMLFVAALVLEVLA
jgi:hypothetical protein